MIGRLQCLVIDCKDPDGLGAFYESLLGLTRIEDTSEWVTLAGPDGGHSLALQKVETYSAPRWPDPAAPQQMHIDVLVNNLDEAEVQVLGLGAKLLDGSDKPIGFRVYADPEGHPFCLVTPESLT